MSDIVDGLLVQTAAGSDAAFRALYGLMRERLVGLAMGIVGDHQLAEDIAQETLTEVWSTAERYRPELGSAVGWMLRLARFRAIDRVRAEQTDRDRLAVAGSAALAEQVAPIDERLEARLSIEPLTQALDRLTPLQREAIRMTHLEGRTFLEAAGALGVPVGTLKSRVHEGMLRLRAILEPGVDDDVAAPRIVGIRIAA